MEVIATERLPIKNWATELEESAMAQARNLANLPFAFHHVALMPDCHMGYGMPIGGVMATKGVVVPGAVGVDIGCGVSLMKTNTYASEAIPDRLKKVMQTVREMIPMGLNGNHKKGAYDLLPHIRDISPVVSTQLEKAMKALGTLGGGNHFLEFQVNSDGYLCVMIHSGSRNLGKQVADYYNKKAIELNEKYFSVVDRKQDLAFLPLDTGEAQLYLTEMDYCLEFAKRNRQLMMLRVREALGEEFPDIIDTYQIDVHHNYAKMEHHFGQNVLVHRKGATSAYEGEKGLIPGSQGTSSYMVEGLGNQESFRSCSHGAGRKMGRKQAQRTLDLATEIKKLDDLGVVHGIRNTSDLDEAAGAYKSIDEVMKNQADLVGILDEFTPLAVMKG